MALPVVRQRAITTTRSLITRRALTTEAISQGQGSSKDPWNCFTHFASPVQSETTTTTTTPQDGTSTSQDLAGWSVSVKDNFCTTEMPTTCSSKMLEGYHPTFDAAVVSALRRAGAKIVGKTNCDEFGMGSSNVHSHYGPVINPARGPPGSDPRVSGGSSGGAAASVRAGLCRVAIGSDTGGSIRLPASHCGVWGFKPSYGLISRWGLVSYADSLDTVGIAGRGWSDCQRTFNVLSFHDQRDQTSMSEAVRRKARGVAKDRLKDLQGIASGSLEGLRVGIPEQCFPEELGQEVLKPFSATVDFIASRGATIVPVSLPTLPLALSAYYVIASAEASSNMGRYDGVRYGHRAAPHASSSSSHIYARTRSEGFGDEVKKRILLGTHALSAEAFDNTFLKAQAIRRKVQDDFNSVFSLPNVLCNDAPTTNGGPPTSGSSSVDVLIHPSTVSTAPLLRPSAPPSPLQEYVQDVLAVPCSLAGLPAVSMPTGLATDGWPVGTTAVSQWGMEDVLGALAGVVMEMNGVDRLHEL